MFIVFLVNSVYVYLLVYWLFLAIFGCSFAVHPDKRQLILGDFTNLQ